MSGIFLNGNGTSDWVVGNDGLSIEKKVCLNKYTCYVSNMALPLGKWYLEFSGFSTYSGIGIVGKNINMFESNTYIMGLEYPTGVSVNGIQMGHSWSFNGMSEDVTTGVKLEGRFGLAIDMENCELGLYSEGKLVEKKKWQQKNEAMLLGVHGWYPCKVQFNFGDSPFVNPPPQGFIGLVKAGPQYLVKNGMSINAPIVKVVSDNIVEIGKIMKDLSVDDFTTHGMSTTLCITPTVEGFLNDNWQIIEWSNGYDLLSRTQRITAIPYDQFVYAKEDIDLSGYGSIDWIRSNDGTVGFEVGNGKVRHVVSRDQGKTYWVYNGTEWIKILDTALPEDGAFLNGRFTPSAAAMARIMASGMTKAQFDAAPWQGWLLNAGFTKIRFAYGLSMEAFGDVAFVDNLKIQYDGQGNWSLCANKVDYKVHATPDTYEVEFLAPLNNSRVKVNY